MTERTRIDIGKVAITLGGVWKADETYEALTMVVYEKDGCGYISFEDNVGVAPDSDVNKWMLAVKAGMSIYDLSVKNGTFKGTEEEFVAQYNDTIKKAEQAAIDAKTKTDTVIVEAQGRLDTVVADANNKLDAKIQVVDNTMAGYAQNEESRRRAEEARAINEDDRIDNENSRQAMESERIGNEHQRELNESQRILAENTRVDNDEDRGRLTTQRLQEMETSIGLSDEAVRNANTAVENANLATKETQEATANTKKATTDAINAVNDLPLIREVATSEQTPEFPIVRYDKQNLNEAQMAQARENIGAAPASAVVNALGMLNGKDGIALQSPNGTQFILSVDNEGKLVVTRAI